MSPRQLRNITLSFLLGILLTGIIFRVLTVQILQTSENKVTLSQRVGCQGGETTTSAIVVGDAGTILRDVIDLGTASKQDQLGLEVQLKGEYESLAELLLRLDQAHLDKLGLNNIYNFVKGFGIKDPTKFFSQFPPTVLAQVISNVSHSTFNCNAKYPNIKVNDF